jgi:hypothetical protein
MGCANFEKNERPIVIIYGGGRVGFVPNTKDDIRILAENGRSSK